MNILFIYIYHRNLSTNSQLFGHRPVTVTDCYWITIKLIFIYFFKEAWDILNLLAPQLFVLTQFSPNNAAFCLSEVINEKHSDFMKKKHKYPSQETVSFIWCSILYAFSRFHYVIFLLSLSWGGLPPKWLILYIKLSVKYHRGLNNILYWGTFLLLM